MNAIKLFVSLLFICSPSYLFGQEVVRFDNGEWERKQNREEVARIFDGRVDTAIINMRRYLAGHNSLDPEIYFGLSLAHSVKRMPDSSYAHFSKAIQLGLPFTRFLAGPREAFTTLYQDERFLAYLAQHPIDLVHGPLLGAVSETSAKIWVRTRTEAQVRIHVKNGI